MESHDLLAPIPKDYCICVNVCDAEGNILGVAGDRSTPYPIGQVADKAVRELPPCAWPKYDWS